MQRSFVGMCLLALAVAVAFGLQTDVSDPQPAWALGSPPFEKLMVTAAFFFVFYLVLVVLYLAAQGRPFTKFTVGPAGVEAPETLSVADQTNDNLEGLKTASEGLATAVADHENRLRKLEGLPPLPDSNDGG